MTKQGNYKAKPKKCRNTECNNEFTPYNSLQKYCSYTCAKSDEAHLTKKPRKPIRTVSKKRAKELPKYIKLREEFLSKPENQMCPITGQQTTDIHHKFSGKDRAKYFLDTTTWLAVSRVGHTWIHDNPKEAREKGFLL